MSMKKLTDRLQAEADKKTEQVNARLASERKLAELWDVHCAVNTSAAQCMQPWILHNTKLHGAIGSYAFKDATPEQCAELLAAFPPEPTVITKGQWTSWRPAAYISAEDRESGKVTSESPVVGGASIGLDCSQHSSTVKVEWFTLLSGELVQLSVQLTNIYGVTPHMTARVEYADPAHHHISRISDAAPSYAIKPIAPLAHIRYSAGAANYFPHILIYDNVPAYIEQLAGYCYSQRRASRKAYQEDKCAGLPPVSAPASDQTYDSQKLRAGTREQYECLHSEAARRDHALAEKHWKAYAEDYGIESTQGYFDNYAWACAYLKRHGLYEVPDPRDTSKMYKYGAAWL